MARTTQMAQYQILQQNALINQQSPSILYPSLALLFDNLMTVPTVEIFFIDPRAGTQSVP